MEKVLNQAELLAEAILESEEYIAMRLAEQAAMKDEKATQLIAAYTEKRQAVENLPADANMDHGALAKAGEELENVEHAIDEKMPESFGRLTLIKSKRYGKIGISVYENTAELEEE